MAREISPHNPERGNLIPLERGGGRFGVITEPRIPTPTREAPPPPIRRQNGLAETLEEALTGYPGKINGKPKGNKTLKIAVSLGALAAVATAAWGIEKSFSDDQSPSANSQTRSVDSFDNSFNPKEGGPALVESKKVNPEEIFDNKARSGEIGRTKRISEEEIAELDSFAKIDDHNTVLAIHPIDVSKSDKTDAKIKYVKRNGGSGNDQDRANRAEEGYLNSLYFEKVPAGSTILAPVDGTLTLFYSYPKKLRDLYPNLIDQDYNISTAAINFQSGDGEKYRLIIGGGRLGGRMNPKPEHFIGLRSLTDAPIIKGEMSPSEVLQITEQRSIPIKKGQPILQLPDKEFNIDFAIRSQDSDPSKEKEEIINGKKMLIVQEEPTNLELFLSEDGAIVQPQLPTPVTN